MVVTKPTARGRAASSSIGTSPEQMWLHNQASRLGVECCQELKWLSWKAGQEHERTLTVKNVSPDVLHLSWTTPHSKLFGIEFPEPVNLSPGISCNVVITFRPIRQEAVEDQITFACQRGKFVVPLRACLPAVKLQVPESLEFGLTPVNGQISQVLTVQNTGEAVLNCSWEASQPFSISPLSASIEAGQSAAFVCIFYPPEAAVYTVLAACSSDTGYTATVKVSGIGKYPFLTLERNDLRFGDVLVGEQVKQAVRLINAGMVPADFAVMPAHSAAAAVAHHSVKITPSRGTLEPAAAATLTVSYTPTTSGTVACEHFAVHTAGSRQIPFSVSGTARAPTVQLSTGCLSFGSLAANESLAKAVYIHNHADLPVYFEFVTDQQGVFAFDRVHGSVAAQSSGCVTVTFRPKEAFNFWRRITCLVRDGAAMTLDLLGTCYTDQLRPPTLTSQHIGQWLSHNGSVTALGAATVSPQSAGLPLVDNMLQTNQELAAAGEASGFILGAPEGSFVDASIQAEAQAPAGQSALSLSQVGPSAWQGFFNRPSNAQGVSVSASELNFGACSRLSPGSHKTLTVTNTTGAKLTAFLAVPEWQGLGSQSQPHQVFQVFPDQLDIRANSSATFRVAFRPPLDRQYFSQIMEVVVVIKAQRSFRGVSEDAVAPPWTFPVQVLGNSFLHQQEQPDTKVQLSTSLVGLAPCLPGQATYQTVMLMNHGDNAVQFDVQGLSQFPGFECRPERGVVGPQSWQLLGLCFRSSHKGSYTAHLNCVINSSQVDAQQLVVQATVCNPALQLEPAGSLFFKPTCIGACSQRAHVMHNTSGVPLTYQWDVPQHAAGSFAVQPQTGLLHANERQTVTWTFAPSDKSTYDINATCRYGSPSDSLDVHVISGGQASAAEGPSATASGQVGAALSVRHSQQVGLTLVGQGTVGALTLEPSSINFGTIAVGFPAVQEITLLNQSGGNLCYSITCTARINTEPAAASTAEPTSAAHDQVQPADSSVDTAGIQAGVASSTSSDESALHLVIDEPQGSLPARATKTIRLTLNPVCCKQYRLQLVCHTATASLLGADGHPVAAKAAAVPADLSPPPICAAVEAFSTYPTLMIADVACESLDKPILWGQMSCSEINTELASEMTQAELILDAKKLNGGYTTHSALEMLPPFHMDMGVGGIDSRPLCVIIRLTNPGSLPVDWDLQRVGDMGFGVEVENWVEPSRPRSDKEKLHDFIVKEGVLQLQPLVGSLGPGQSTTWAVTYRHCAVGRHDLSILLAIKDSKQLHLHLTGVTVPSSHLCLSLMDRPFQLAPVPIGERDPPRQTYCLRNGGPAELPFVIDTSPLQQLVKLNYGYEVLKLLEAPEGVIAPGDVAGLNFIFSPVEARVYDVTLPIKLGNGTKSALQLTGKGYHPGPLAAAGPLSADATEAADTATGVSTIQWHSQVDAAADKATWPGFSAASSVQLPQQLLSLSQNLVSFGPVSIQGVSKRVVALLAGPDFGVKYEWQLGVLAQERGLLGGLLQVEPSSGTLEPNSCCLCKLTFSAGVDPQLFEAGITCNVSPVAEASTPLQPARGPSVNSPLNSPRTAANSASQDDSPSKMVMAESAQHVARNRGSAQHGQRSPRLVTSPKKGSPRPDQHLAGAPVRQGSLGSPERAGTQSSPNRAASSQNRAPISRTSSSSSAAQKQGSSPRSPSRGSVKPSTASSLAKAVTKAGRVASTSRNSSPISAAAKPSVKSPHKRRLPGASSGPVAEVVEEVIAEHPAPPSHPYTPGSRLAARPPVHAAMTASMCQHFPGHTPTVAPSLSNDHDAERPPEPQVLVVNVEGRVLTPDQMRAGLYILPSEAALASDLLQGGLWAPAAPAQHSADDRSPAAQDVHQASILLQDMLAEVVNGSDVATALAGLLEEETPTLAELRQGSRLHQPAVPLPAGAASEAWQDLAESDSTSTSLGATLEQSEAKTPHMQQAIVQSQQPEEEAEGGNADDAGMSSVLCKAVQQPGFQTFVEYVLESACFSLLQESAADRWQAP